MKFRSNKSRRANGILPAAAEWRAAQKLPPPVVAVVFLAPEFAVEIPVHSVEFAPLMRVEVTVAKHPFSCPCDLFALHLEQAEFVAGEFSRMPAFFDAAAYVLAVMAGTPVTTLRGTGMGKDHCGQDNKKHDLFHFFKF